MTRDEFRRLVGMIEQRWRSVAEKIAKPDVIGLWWRTLQNHSFADLSEVLDKISSGDLDRPYDSQFLAALNRQSNAIANRRRRAAGPPPARRALAMIAADDQAAAEDREQVAAWETAHGPTIDAMPLPDLIALARGAAGPLCGRMIAADRHSALARPIVLEAFAKSVSRS